MATLPLLLSLLCVSALAAGGAPAGSAVATSCRLTLAPFIYSPNASRHFLSGSVNISLRASAPSTTMRWFSSQVQFRGQDVIVEGGEVSDKMWVPDGSISLTIAAKPGDEFTVAVRSFRAEVKAIEYLETENKTKFAASSLGLLMHEFVPLLDDSAARVTVDVSIVRRSDFSAASNSESFSNRTEDNVASWWPEVDASEISDFSWTRETFATTSVIPMSSLQFMVSQMAQVAAVTDSKGRQHRFWSSSLVARILASVSKDVVILYEHLEQRFGVDSPVSKVDYFLLMSEQGNNSGFSFSIGIGTLRLRRRYAMPASRLGCEQLLYILARQLSGAWLRQVSRGRALHGMAWAHAFTALTNLRPDWRVNSLELINLRKWWQYKLVGVRQGVGRNATLVQLPRWYGFHPAAVFIQLRAAVGAGAYDAAVRAIVHDFVAFAGWPSQHQLVARLTEAVDDPVVARRAQEMMHSYAITGQLPVVTCSVRGDQLVLSQQPIRGGARTTPITWTIPITMVTSDNATTSDWYAKLQWERVQWLTQQRQSFSSFNTRRPPSWYLLNLRGLGLYRVNYDADNWAALSRLLIENHELLHPLERAMLLEDSFELARAGMLNYSVPTNILRYVVKEKHPMLLHKLFGFFKYFCDMPDVWPPVRASACQLQASESFSSAPAKPRVPKAGGQQLGCPSLLENDSPESDDASWMEKVTAGYRRDILLQLRSRCVSNYA